MTPRQFRLLMDRWQDRERREYIRAGIVASTIVNFGMGLAGKRGDCTAMDFVPGFKRSPKDPLLLWRVMVAMTGAPEVGEA